MKNGKRFAASCLAACLAVSLNACVATTTSNLRSGTSSGSQALASQEAASQASAVQGVVAEKKAVDPAVQTSVLLPPSRFVALSSLKVSAFSPFRAALAEDRNWFHGASSTHFEECPHCKALGKIISSEYGMRRDPRRRGVRLHHGIDIRALKGSGALAFMGGEVVKASRNGAYGLCIEIRQDDGMVARYAHLSKMDVKPGQRVESGQQIGATGSTGRVTGPHLHFELIRDGKSLDPMQFLTRSEQVMRCVRLETAGK